MIWTILGSILATGTLAAIAYNSIHKKQDKIYSGLKHVKVGEEWKQIVYDSWVRASNILQMNGIAAKTKCSKIIVENGEKFNPNTKQWGKKSRDGFWYSGLASGKWIKIVADKDGHPYSGSKAILTHEIAETIIDLHPKWSKASCDERNIFLWGIGL